MHSGSCVAKVNSASREGRRRSTTEFVAAETARRSKEAGHKSAEQQTRTAIQLREMTQVWLHEYQEPWHDKEEQWDVMPEPEPQVDKAIPITKVCNMWRDTEEAAGKRSGWSKK